MTTGQMLIPVAVILACAGYFLPFLIADHKKHKNLPAIFGLNLVLGWTVIGWIAALFWAVSYNPQPSPACSEES
ncbi:superinfection immunity protein [Serratia sp. M24T3]|uniref:superinfection immunity protein n=1 Tax=Serratia sp. M24T3 TaxID=932213 RepID=UPI00025B9308|nr:superinfection immunity protein [Serratia sp. M24T3]EIC85485.1 hypothetical protein SPM24T3_06468 [Serratia sp. M24T3]